MPKPNIVDKKYNFLRPIKTKGLIRLGGKEDGGYIISKKALEDCDFLLSFGMSNDWSFEQEFLKHNFKNEQTEHQYLIYGLDADLIMLSMASKLANIYLLRESVCDFPIPSIN